MERQTRALRLRGVLLASLLAALAVIAGSTYELSATLSSGAASTSSAIALEQARQAGELAIAQGSTQLAQRKQGEAEQLRASSETARAALAAELEQLAPAPRPNDSMAGWTRGAIVSISRSGHFAGAGFAVSYRGSSTYVITALHILQGGGGVTVVTRQGPYAGRLVAVSAADAALLEVNTLAPFMPFRGTASVGDSVTIAGADDRVETATVARVSVDVLELNLPARPSGYWPGFSGSPVIAANGYAIGIMSAGLETNGIAVLGVAVPRSATCDILACP